jgi:hypothetical protein
VDTPRGWYWATLTPPRSTWSDIVVPFSAFKPYTRRGEPDIREPFDADTEMVSVGLLVYNKRAERFTVSLDWLDIV